MARKVASAPSFLNFCCTRLTIAVASSLVPNSAASAGIATMTEANKAAKNATARDIRFLPTVFPDARRRHVRPVRSQGTWRQVSYATLARGGRQTNVAFFQLNDTSKFHLTDCNQDYSADVPHADPTETATIIA